MFYVLAAILTAVAALLFWLKNREKAKLFQIQSTETSSAAHLADTARTIAADLGPGSFRQRTEVKGQAESTQALTSEWSQKPVVWYQARVYRDYEETVWKESDGKRYQTTERGSELIYDNTLTQEFSVRDSSGSILVNPDGAEVEARVTYAERQGPGAQGFQVGKWNMKLAAFAGGRRTLGYRLEERSLPVGTTLYVLAEASDLGGKLAMRKPEAKGERFLISYRSEEEMVAAAKKASAGLAIGSLVCLILGALALAWALLNPNG